MTEQISMSVTTYNESKRQGGKWCEGPWIFKCIEAAMDHPLVGEVVVCDDASNDFDWLYETIDDRFAHVGPKFGIHHGRQNLGTFGNKLRSLSMCSHPFVLMADSDNFFDSVFFDRLAALQPFDEHCLYSPSVGRPKLKYEHMIGTYNATRWLEICGEKLFTCLLNTGNQLVPRKPVLELFHDHMGEDSSFGYHDYFGENLPPDVKRRSVHDAAECGYMNTRWLMAGNKIHVVGWLKYEHRCDLKESAYMDAPPLKKVLAPAYMLELASYVEGEPHTFQYHSQKRIDGKLYYRYKRNDGQMWQINPQSLDQRERVACGR